MFRWLFYAAVVVGMILLVVKAIRRFRNFKWRWTDPVGYYRARTESWIERRLYNALVKRGYRVITQYPCGPYRIDLALPDYGIAIECDGEAYHSTPEQKRHDRRKDNYLRKHGWSVMRFKGSQINGQMPKVIARIERKIESVKSG